MVFSETPVRITEFLMIFNRIPMGICGISVKCNERQFRIKGFHSFSMEIQCEFMILNDESRPRQQLKSLHKPKQYSVRTRLRWKTSTAPGGPLGPRGAARGAAMDFHWVSMEIQWEFKDFQWFPTKISLRIMDFQRSSMKIQWTVMEFQWFPMKHQW